MPQTTANTDRENNEELPGIDRRVLLGMFAGGAAGAALVATDNKPPSADCPAGTSASR